MCVCACIGGCVCGCVSARVGKFTRRGTGYILASAAAVCYGNVCGGYGNGSTSRTTSGSFSEATKLVCIEIR